MSTPLILRVDAPPTLPAKPSIGRVVLYFAGDKVAARQDDYGHMYVEPSLPTRPFRADVIDTLAEVSHGLSSEMHVHLDVSGSAAFAPFIAYNVPYSETPTPGTHRWCWPPRV